MNMLKQRHCKTISIFIGNVLTVQVGSELSERRMEDMERRQSPRFGRGKRRRRSPINGNRLVCSVRCTARFTTRFTTAFKFRVDRI